MSKNNTTGDGEETKTQEQLQREAEAKKKAAIQRRLKKKAERKSSDATNKKLETLEQENRILKEKLNPTPATKPTLESCGGDTALFEKNLDLYYKGQKQKEVDQSVSERVKQHEQTQALESQQAEVQRSIDAYYEKAIDLNIEGFQKAEDNAIEWLGEDIVQEVIHAVDNPVEVIHLLGSNEEEAESLLNALKKSATRGTVALGRLSARADKFQGKKEGEDDEDLEPENIPEGGSLPVGDAALKRKHEKLVKACSEGTGDMKELRKVRAQMREKGLLTD